MTEQGPTREPAPPARPRFEFREPPSAVEAPRPRVVTVSHGLWLAACLVGLLTAVVTLTDLDPLRLGLSAIAQRDFPNEDPATRDRAVMLTLAILIGAGLLIVLLELVLATAMRVGRNVRAVLAGFGILGALYAALMLEAATPPIAIGLVASSALAVAAAVVMYLPGARPWVTRRRR